MQPFRLFFRLDARRAVGIAVLLCAPLPGALTASNAEAQTSPFQPSAAQPVLPPGGSKPKSPVVESLMDRRPPVLEVRKGHRHVGYPRYTHHRDYARARAPARDLERPALAGVELLQSLPRPGEPPHFIVPVPVYPLDSFIAAYTMPPPPIVCHPTRREPGLPDPRLYRERTVACEADNP